MSRRNVPPPPPSQLESSSSRRGRSATVPSVLEVVTNTNTNTNTTTPPSDDEDDNDDDDTPLNQLIHPSQQRITPSNRRRLTIESSDDDDDDDDMIDDPAAVRTTTATTKPRPTSASRPLLLLLDDDDDSDEENDGSVPPVTTRNTRRTTTTTPPSSSSHAILPKSRKTKVLDDDDDDEYQDDEDEDESDRDNDNDDDDSAFIPPTSDVSVVGDADDDYDDDDDDDVEAPPRRGDTVQKVGLVQDGEIGERDIDDDDDDDSSIIVIPKPFGTPLCLEHIEPRLHRPTTTTLPYHHPDSDSDDGLRSSNHSSSSSGTANRRHHKKSIPKCVRCDSTKDAITAEDLPPLHVCFFPPDNQSKLCFALDTLRKIALAQPDSRKLVHNSDAGTLERAPTVFLQPPHFRTPMSDDLLDQIASRFGRAATNVHSDYYQRRHHNVEDDDDDTTHYVPTGSATCLAQSESIVDQLDRFMRQRLGNQDIYCCPICYVVAHQRLATSEDAIRRHGNDDDDSDDDRDDDYLTDFGYDPMTVLGDIGTCGDPFRIASTLCYKKVSLLKEHLRRDHHVDTKVVDGNDLYSRFKIRAQDGLLQRYLNKNSGQHAPTRQGEMLQYWIYGNNCDFVLLLSLMAHANLCREITKDSDALSDDDPAAVENAEQYLLPCDEFFESFAKDARSIWNVVTSPFRKITKEEINDFIADDEYDEQEDSDVAEAEEPFLSHQALHMQAELEELERERYQDERLAERYENEVKRLRQKDDDSLDQSVVDDERDVASDDDDDPQVSAAESDSMHDDEWQTSILEKRVTRIKALTPQKRAGRRRVSMSSMKVASPKKRWNAIRTDDKDDAESPLVTASSSAVRKRLAIQDSDEE